MHSTVWLVLTSNPIIISLRKPLARRDFDDDLDSAGPSFAGRIYSVQTLTTHISLCGDGPLNRNSQSIIAPKVRLVSAHIWS